jgi:hypothetical protein
MKRRKERILYNYECTLTGEQFTTTEKATNQKELISVKGYYQLHTDKDDRPALMKMKLGLDKEDASAPTESEVKN